MKEFEASVINERDRMSRTTLHAATATNAYQETTELLERGQMSTLRMTMAGHRCTWLRM